MRLESGVSSQMVFIDSYFRERVSEHFLPNDTPSCGIGTDVHKIFLLTDHAGTRRSERTKGSLCNAVSSDYIVQYKT